MSASMDMPEPTGRLIFDESAKTYHVRELGVASNSALKELRRSPAHYRAWIDAEPEADTPSLAFGKAYHCRILEPETFHRTHAVLPDFGDMRSSINRERRDAWLMERPGVTVLTSEQWSTIEAMRAVLAQHKLAVGIIRAGRPEVTMRWQDIETGVQCKARADWFIDGELLMDLKTTDDASPDAFRRSVAKYGYHVQHAHYCDGAKACGAKVRNFLILAQEKAPPYAVAVYHVDADAEFHGYSVRNAGLRVMADCMAKNEWPGYPPGITELSLPSWATKENA